MEAKNRWRSVALTFLLVASPWLAVQGWIVTAAHDPEHTTMPTCPDPTPIVLRSRRNPSFEWTPN